MMSPRCLSRLRDSAVSPTCGSERSIAPSRSTSFDTILLLGNNLGILAGEQQGRRLLRARPCTDRGRILAGS